MKEGMQLNMSHTQAKYFWWECYWAKGGDWRTVIGIGALAYGIAGTESSQDLEKAADFLEALAKLIRPSTSK